MVKLFIPMTVTAINSSTISMLNQLNQFNAQFAQEIVVELYKAHIKCYYIINYFTY